MVFQKITFSSAHHYKRKNLSLVFLLARVVTIYEFTSISFELETFDLGWRNELKGYINYQITRGHFTSENSYITFLLYFDNIRLFSNKIRYLSKKFLIFQNSIIV